MRVSPLVALGAALLIASLAPAPAAALSTGQWDVQSITTTQGRWLERSAGVENLFQVLEGRFGLDGAGQATLDVNTGTARIAGGQFALSIGANGRVDGQVTAPGARHGWEFIAFGHRALGIQNAVLLSVHARPSDGERPTTYAHRASWVDADRGRGGWFSFQIALDGLQSQIDIGDASADRAAVVPLPAGAWLLFSGLAGLIATRRRR